MRRRPVEERWRQSSVDMVKVAPWQSIDGTEEDDGEQLEVIKLGVEEKQEMENAARLAKMPGKCSAKCLTET